MTTATYVELGYRPTSLEIPEFLDFDTWAELLRSLVATESSMRWWIGALVNYGERVYGDTYTQAMDATGLSYDVLVAYAYVERAVESSTRVEGLSWSHHRAVAKLDQEEQQRFLALAIERDLTVEALTAAVREEYPSSRQASEPPAEPLERRERLDQLERIRSVAERLIEAGEPLSAGRRGWIAVPEPLIVELQSAVGAVSLS